MTIRPPISTDLTFDLAEDNQIPASTGTPCILAVADVPRTRFLCHPACNFVPGASSPGAVEGPYSRGFGMRDLLEEKTIFCTCPGTI